MRAMHWDLGHVQEVDGQVRRRSACGRWFDAAHVTHLGSEVTCQVCQAAHKRRRRVARGIPARVTRSDVANIIEQMERFALVGGSRQNMLRRLGFSDEEIEEQPELGHILWVKLRCW